MIRASGLLYFPAISRVVALPKNISEMTCKVSNSWTIMNMSPSGDEVSVPEEEEMATKNEMKDSAERSALMKAGYKAYYCTRTAEELVEMPFASEIADREQIIDSRGVIWYKRTAEELQKVRDSFASAFAKHGLTGENAGK